MRKPSYTRAFHASKVEPDTSNILAVDDTGDRAADEEIRIISIERIDPMPGQPRRNFAEIKEMSDSIRGRRAVGGGIGGLGIQQPITVRRIVGKSFTNGDKKEPERFQIVTGERRYQGAKLAGLTEVPCIVQDMNDADAFEVAVIENLQRKDLEPLEEAHALAYLMQKKGYTYRSLAEALGIAKGYIENRLNLLRVKDERLLQAVASNPETMTAALTIDKLKTVAAKERLTRELKSGVSHTIVLSKARDVLKQEKHLKEASAQESGEAPRQIPAADLEKAMDAAIRQLESAVSAANHRIPKKIWSEKLRPRAHRISALLDELASLSQSKLDS